MCLPSYTSSSRAKRNILQQIAGLDDDDGEARTTTLIHDAVLGKSTIPLEECISSQPFHIDALDGLGYSPLHWAVLMSSPSAVRTLTKLGANVNCPARHNGETPLHLACHMDFLELALILLDAGASINLQDFTKRAPLHVTYSNTEITKALLDRGADLSVQCKKGQTPLHCMM